MNNNSLSVLNALDNSHLKSDNSFVSNTKSSSSIIDLSKEIDNKEKNNNMISKRCSKTGNIGFSELFITPKINMNGIKTNGETSRSFHSDTFRKKIDDQKNEKDLNSLDIELKQNSESLFHGNDEINEVETSLEVNNKLIENELKIYNDVNILFDELAAKTVIYNESIINQINSDNELKMLKDSRNKLIGIKSQLEIKLETEKVSLLL